ncbi:large conductance mechanosensitive channel protein MscL [bacterium]|jgi:large conductance mechanosensitive channel|nr:large conductance mechanosensitive channel protein MscL [bacterium]
MFQEFKNFILRGNVVDLAVAVIIGASFGAIVNSFITDIVTPLLLQPAMNSLGVAELEKVQWHAVKYGKFLASVISFLVTSFIVFAMIKFSNRLKAKKEEAAPAPTLTKDQELLIEIRDLLKK